MSVLIINDAPYGSEKAYNLERMFKAVIGKGAQVKACGTCSDGRGIRGLTLIEGIEISTMSQLTQWVLESDRVLTF